MTWLIIALLSGAAALAVALLYVANEKAKLHAAEETQPLRAAQFRVRAAWGLLAHELGRPPTTAELIDVLYPPEAGEGAQSHGLPPSHALREMGFNVSEYVIYTGGV